MSKLQAQFTEYMRISLKNEMINYCIAIKNNWNIDVLSLDELKENEVLISQDSDIDTSFFLDNIFDDLSNKKLVLEIKKLTKLQQDILILYVNGESIKNIADRFNVSTGTIKKAIFRIRNRLRKFRKEE